MFWAVLAFSLGMGLGHFAWRPPSWWLAAALSMPQRACISYDDDPSLRQHSPLRRLFLPERSQSKVAQMFPQSAMVRWSEDSFVTAHVTSEGNLQSDGPGSLRQQIELQTERIESQSGTTRPHGCPAQHLCESRSGSGEESFSTLNNSPAAAMPLLHYGQRFVLRPLLTSPRNFHNPGAFDYVEYLREQGLSATVSAKYSGIEILPGFSGSRFGLWRASPQHCGSNSPPVAAADLRTDGSYGNRRKVIRRAH